MPGPLPRHSAGAGTGGVYAGELAGLQAGDRVSVPGLGLRLRRTVLASGGGGALYVDMLKNNRARTVPHKLSAPGGATTRSAVGDA